MPGAINVILAAFHLSADRFVTCQQGLNLSVTTAAIKASDLLKSAAVRCRAPHLHPQEGSGNTEPILFI